MGNLSFLILESREIIQSSVWPFSRYYAFKGLLRDYIVSTKLIIFSATDIYSV